ncbi:MAG: hypothetical protein ABSE51_11700 [Terracidiphilus sp.]|jgi:hypothetical protein
MANDLSSAINEYLDGKNADGFLYSGPINRDYTDRLVKLIDSRPQRRKDVCLFITTFGGDPNAAYRVGRALKANYREGKIIAILGGYCKSAGTLLALCADELAFGCFGELGPLDTQIDKPNEILGAESGLDLFQTLQQITESSFESFEQQMINIIRHSSGAITTKVAAEIASSLTVGIFSPISAQVDPLRLGVARRAIRIGLAYGNRLKSENVKSGTVEKLVNDYPAHGFVIDQKEAAELFKLVRGFDDGEAKIFGIIDHVLRIPDENGIVSDLRTDFSSQPSTPEDGSGGADKDTMGIENAGSHNEQPGNPAEHGASGAKGAGGEL